MIGFAGGVGWRVLHQVRYISCWLCVVVVFLWRDGRFVYELKLTISTAGSVEF